MLPLLAPLQWFFFQLDRVRGIEPVFFKVCAGADPVDDGKQTGFTQGRQHAVPCPAVEIYCLSWGCDERQRLSRCSVLIWCDDDQKTVLGHWNEKL